MSPPTNRLMALLVRLAALAVSIGVLAGCGGGSDGEPGAVGSAEPIGFERLAQAATTSVAATRARFSFGLEVAMPGSDEPFSI